MMIFIFFLFWCCMVGQGTDDGNDKETNDGSDKGTDDCSDKK